MAGDPAHIGRTPINIIGLQVEHIPRGRRRIDHIARRRVQHTFRRTGRARGVENKQRVFRIHHFRRANRWLLRHQLVPPDIA